MTLRRLLFDQPEQKAWAGFRHGFLALICALFAWNVYIFAKRGEAHDATRRRCAENGHTLAGICWEIYGHWEESWSADPSQIRTDVFHLLTEPYVQ